MNALIALLIALFVRGLSATCPVWFKVPEFVDTEAGMCVSEGCSVPVYGVYDVPQQVAQRDGVNPFSSVPAHYIRVDSGQAKYTGYSGQGAAQAWGAIHSCAHSNISAILLSGFHALTNGGIALSMVMDGPESEQLEARIRSALAEVEGLNITEDLPASRAADMGLRLRGETMLYHSLLKHPDRVESLRLLGCFLQDSSNCQWYLNNTGGDSSICFDVADDLRCALQQLNRVDCLHCRLFAAVDLTGIIASLPGAGPLSRNDLVARAYVRQHVQLVLDEVEYRLDILRHHCPGFVDMDSLDGECRQCLSGLFEVEDVCESDYTETKPAHSSFWRRILRQLSDRSDREL